MVSQDNRKVELREARRQDGWLEGRGGKWGGMR